jgi:COP9 signalosome complex subunit 2
VAVIRETGGIISMSEKKWASALDDLFESFKNYLEIADPRAKTILKYTILASVLANSKVNYATTREAKTYQ